jgi:hypothetical protein
MTPDEEIRFHMRACPDHEVTVGTDDAWHCITCEEDDDLDLTPTAQTEGARDPR